MTPTTLASLRASITDAIRAMDPHTSNVYPDDPREEPGFENRVRQGSGIRAWLIEDFNPSATAVIDSSDYSAAAMIIGLRSISKGAKVQLQDDAQLVVRRLRAIPFNRSAIVAGIDTVTVAGRYACYQVTIVAEFYALQTIA